MTGNVANHGYLPGIILKELAAGRSCEITGGIVAHIKTRKDYEDRRYRIIGRFGEVVQRKVGGTALIATREAPEWAMKKIDEVIWECDEMVRWMIPKEQR